MCHSMYSTATMAGPGISRSPASQRRIVRSLSTRSARAIPLWDSPSAFLASLNSVGVIVLLRF
ncbi:MAG: hypothetical protein OEM93_10465 [Rhodospirillales bacterium]|nr:hypothetical protein [Rhodospirillales bacterium]